MKRLCLKLVYIGLWFVLIGCTREQPQVIVITATFPPATPNPTLAANDSASITGSIATPTAIALALSPVPQQILNQPTPNPTRAGISLGSEHVVQSGDTLSGIAARYNVSIDAILAVNELLDPNVLAVGQVIQLPEAPSDFTPEFKLLPDSRFVRGPDSTQFDIASFIAQQPGFISRASDKVKRRIANGAELEETLSSAQVVERVALEYSVDPRVLLMILEYRAGWLSNPAPLEALQTHPLISVANSAPTDRSGLYKQLAWAANSLNRGYYAWKYGDFNQLEFDDGTRVSINPGLNAASTALQFFLSGFVPYNQWQFDVSQDGFYRLYFSYFGDPFQNPIEPLVPTALQQPAFSLPFGEGEVWYFTGGAHGGWGGGSAWAALDFAPPDERTPNQPLCYTSAFAVRAAAPGVIARSGEGVVVLDLDGDGDEATGWTILYLHLADEGLIPAGQRVLVGDAIGRASCAGGFSTATHLHIARRYNGEWLPVDCNICAQNAVVPPFIMSDWIPQSIEGQEYQGFLQRGAVQLQAEQGRQTLVNRISR